MKFRYRVLYRCIFIFSLLPMHVLHGISDLMRVWVHRVFKYRLKVVRENLTKAFPGKSVLELRTIEKDFYRNFCDLIVETIKTFSISEKEMNERCVLTTPQIVSELFQENLSLTGISSHLANWEWLALSLALKFKHQCYGVYKPLSNQSLDEMVHISRERFGIRMISLKILKDVLESPSDCPVMVGLLSDQAPHHYERAFEVEFLHQRTFVVPGPGVITVQRDFTPIWGWMRRTGRSRFEWGIERLEGRVPHSGFSGLELEQVSRIAQMHSISTEQASRAFAITQEFCKKLESQIHSAPADWLWSHRRWKSR